VRYSAHSPVPVAAALALVLAATLLPASCPAQEPSGWPEESSGTGDGRPANCPDDACLCPDCCCNGATTFRLRGRIETDAIGTIQSTANEATFGDLGDAIGLRRARIGAEGDLAIGGRYVTELDLASGDVVLRDVFFALGQRQDAGECRLGRYLEPFSLELGTSSNHFAFMERSPANLLDPARNWGLGWFQVDESESRTLALGVFQAGTDANDFEDGQGSTLGVTGRITTTPLNVDEGRQLLHLGLAVSERWPQVGLIVIKQQAQSPLVEVLGDTATSPFVPQIRIPATFQQLANLQCGAASGPLWGQAEWYGTWIHKRDGSPVFLHGCYAGCGYFLTGEHRRYQSVGGVPGAVRVNRPLLHCCTGCNRPAGCGAWELVARFAYLDFVDRDVPPGPGRELVGIRLAQSTFGVNWYLSDHVRIMFNYSYAIPDEPNTGTSAASVFGTRLAVHW